MRRSKVQRQEARRERRLKTFRRKENKDEQGPQMFTVVRTDDARHGKYLWCEHEGMTLEQAERLAAPVPGQTVRYSVVPIEVHRFARTLGEPVSPPKAQLAYEHKKRVEEAA